MGFLHRYRSLIIAIAAYAVVFGLVTAFRHHNFQTQTWDMGVFDQLFWNTINGRVMQGSIEEIPNHFGIHWSPGLLLLVPGYALFPSPYYLLIIQTLALALGAWPLYRLAMRVLQREPLAKLIAIAYLAYPTLHWVNLFDFHEIAFIVPLMFAGMYAVESGRLGHGLFFLAFAASMKEDAIIVVSFYALYALLRRQEAARWWTRERIIASLALLGFSAYFLLTIKVFMPAFGGGLLRLDRYAELGGSLGEIFGNVIAHPSLIIKTVATFPKLMYVFWLLVPVIGLPLFSGRALLLLVPGLLENLLTTYQFQFAGFYQYDALLIPGIFLAAIIGIRNILRRMPQYTGILRKMLIAGILIGFFIRSPINPLAFPFGLFGTNERWESYRMMLANHRIPQNTSVAAETNLLPHLSRREKVYPLSAEPALADIAFIDAGDAFGFADEEAFRLYIARYTANADYGATVYRDRYIVAEKKQ